MSQKQTLIKGTFILTAAGIATRLIGFFYRIFLSRIFHAEGVGLYQLIFPVYALCFSATSAGIQVALSRIVAKNTALKREKEALCSLKAALLFTTTLSFFAALLIQHFAKYIALRFLNEPRCEVLLIAMSWSFPFAAIHSGICGYYLGRKETKVPALSQLLEQAARVLSVWFFYRIGLHTSMEQHITIAVLGLVCGEMIASLYSAFTLRRALLTRKCRPKEYLAPAAELLRLSAPLTANRVFLNLLQSVEAVSIPLCLTVYGMPMSQALSIYGILTGMALPCILFPSALTNSISTMLLPAVAEIQTRKKTAELRRLTLRVSFACLMLGSLCMACFFFTGNFIGNVIFHNADAGKFIMTLAFMCPFLYTNTALISILNGLGKTTTTFFINMIGLGVRIGSIYLLIPRAGILGYLWGLLGSQGIVALLAVLVMRHDTALFTGESLS